MYFWKTKIIFLTLTLASAGVFFVATKQVHASASLDRIFSAAVPTTAGVPKVLRVDPIDGTVYSFAVATGSFYAVSADGSAVTTVNYNVALPAMSGIAAVVTGGTAYIVINGSTNGIYKYIRSGGVANFVASSTLSASGASAMTFGSPGTIYVTKSTTGYTLDTDLNTLSSTGTVAAVPTYLGYGNGQLFYQTSGGLFRRTSFNAASDSTIASGGPISSNVRGSLAASNDGTALYYASSTGFAKLLTSGVKVWSKTVSNLAAIDVSTSTGRVTVVDNSGMISTYNPINTPSSFSASASGTSAMLNWTTGVTDSDFSGVTIRRSTTSHPTSASDGIAVTSTMTSASSFIDSGLSNGTTYYYTIFNETADGYYSSGVTSTVTISPDAPLLSASATGNQINLSWTVPAYTANFELRRDTTDFPVSHTDGTAVTTTDSSVANLTESGMPDGTYYYSIFAVDSEGNYSTAGTSSVHIDMTAPSAPSGFTATPSGNTINLTWSNPADSDFTSVMLRRSTVNYPSSITDATLVTSTVGTSYMDASLADGTYYYSIFAFDGNNNSSIQATSNAAVNTYVPPTPSISYGGGSIFITPIAFMATPLNFMVANGVSVGNNIKVSSPTIALQLNADPTIVKGYAISLDPTFKNSSILPLPPIKDKAIFTLPNKAGVYTVHLKYYSATGYSSDTIVQTVAYTPTTIGTTANTGTNTKFARTLKLGMSGVDVKALQVFLNSQGYVVAKTGAGSPGYETNFYGPATARAVTKLQEAHKDTILKGYGLEKGTGIFAAATMAFVNAVR